MILVILLVIVISNLSFETMNSTMAKFLNDLDIFNIIKSKTEKTKEKKGCFINLEFYVIIC